VSVLKVVSLKLGEVLTVGALVVEDPDRGAS
jgi:hypothetical protein